MYRRRVQFYETDAQGIVHHSNYPKYFEEARGELLRSKGVPYSHLRSLGYEVILTDLSCHFKKPCYYDEILDIHLKVEEVNRYFFKLSYRVMVKDELRVLAFTKHALIKDRRLVSLIEDIRRVLHEMERCGS